MDTLKEKKDIIMMAAGTGITPMLQLIQFLLQLKSTNVSIWLFFFNKTQKDMAFKQELKEVGKKFSHFSCQHILSKPEEDWKGITGRISVKLLNQILPKPRKERIAFMCGPVLFIKDGQR